MEKRMYNVIIKFRVKTNKEELDNLSFGQLLDIIPLADITLIDYKPVRRNRRRH